MAFADTIVVLEDGRIVENGSAAGILRNASHVNKLGLSVLPDGETTEIFQDTTRSDLAREEFQDSADILEDEDNRHTDLRRKNGDMSIYKYYLERSGWGAVGLYTVFITLWWFCTEFSRE